MALTLGNLGNAHGALGDNSKKCELLERALAIVEGAYGSNHPHTEMCQSNLNNARVDLEFPLHAAAKRGDIDAIMRLLDDDGAEVNQVNESGATALLFACQCGHVDAARVLLDRGADVHTSNSYNTTPLHMACYKGHIEVVRMLLNSGATTDLDRMDGDGATPMANAESRGHAAVVDLLAQYT